jgi:hypothetical protein
MDGNIKKQALAREFPILLRLLHDYKYRKGGYFRYIR